MTPTSSPVMWLIAFVLVGIGLLRLAWRRRGGASRQRRLMVLCQRAGLDFAPLDLFGDTAWLPFPMFGRPQRASENVVWEAARPTGVRAFDFWFEDPEEDPTPIRHRLTCAVVPLTASASLLRIAPRSAADAVTDVLTLPEVRLELEEFNRRFVVETDDGRFAVAFLEQRMMEAILALPDGVTVDVNEDVVLLSAPLLPAEQVLRLYQAALAIHRRIPRSLADRYPPRPHRGPFEARWLQGRWSPDPTGAAGSTTVT